VRGIRHVSRLRGGPELLGWLYRTATNLAFNRLRDARAQQTSEAAAADAMVPHAPSLEAAFSDRQLLAKLIGNLDETTRLIAIYVFVDGMTHEEAARLAGVAPRTVRNKLEIFLDRARARLGRTSLT
jgi:RNA polymerase sigma-70 factor (ECF subfamily)